MGRRHCIFYFQNKIQQEPKGQTSTFEHYMNRVYFPLQSWCDLFDVKHTTFLLGQALHGTACNLLNFVRWTPWETEISHEALDSIAQRPKKGHFKTSAKQRYVLNRNLLKFFFHCNHTYMRAANASKGVQWLQGLTFKIVCVCVCVCTW